MRKKFIVRCSLLLLAVVLIAALVNPYSRQWVFGPKYAGVPLCAWQDRIRREINPDRKDDFVAKLVRWFQPKNAALPADKLSRQDKIGIWLTLLDDPLPAVRTQAIRTLWDGHGQYWSRSWVSGAYTTDLGFTSLTIDSSESTRFTIVSFSGELPIRDSLLGTAIHPPCDVAPHLVRMLEDSDADVRGAVFAALSHHKKKAEPAFGRLFELLGHEDPVRRGAAATTLNQTHPKTRVWLDRLIAMLDDADADVRRQITVCIQGWHDRRMVVAAGPALLKTLRDPDAYVRIRAATTLAALQLHRPLAAATIRAELRHVDPAVRNNALANVFDAGDAGRLFAELTHCVQTDPDKSVRRAAVGALRTAGKQAVPLLISLLHHPEKDTRHQAIGALTGLRAEARTATPVLLALLEDDCNAETISALATIGDARALPKLIELLDDSSMCNHALAALYYFGPRASAAAPKLVKMLETASTEICQQAARTLTAMELPAAEFAALLEPLLRDGTSQAYQHAVFLLADAAPDREALLPALKRLAFDLNNTARTEAFRRLHDLGPKARSLVPLALKGLSHVDEGMPSLCIQLLGAIGPDAAAAVPALMRLAEPPDANQGAHAIAALGAIAVAEDKVVPLLLRLLAKENTRDSAAAALAGFGPRARAAVPALLPLLGHERTSTRLTAAQTLIQIADRIDDALPHLLPMFRDEDEDLRAHIARTLGELGPAARAAVPALSALLDDDNWYVYEAALDALAKIEP